MSWATLVYEQQTHPFSCAKFSLPGATLQDWASNLDGFMPPLLPFPQTLCIVSFNCCLHNTSLFCHLKGTKEASHNNFPSRTQVCKCCLNGISLSSCDLTQVMLSPCKNNQSSSENYDWITLVWADADPLVEELGQILPFLCLSP